jgi:CYTH domain-containing protein
MPNRGLETELGDPKYARLELERRWRVNRAERPSLEGLPATLIEDRYIIGTRMRLRRMAYAEQAETIWKLTKKYDTDRPEARPIVTTYLTESEYALLATLPAHPLRKCRYHLLIDDRTWSIDLFDDGLKGLELVEIEAANEAELASLNPPSWAGDEITHDPRFQCGALAQTNEIPA